MFFGGLMGIGHLETAQWCLNLGLETEFPDINEWSDQAFRWSCAYGQLETTQWIVDATINTESPVDIHIYGST